MKLLNSNFISMKPIIITTLLYLTIQITATSQKLPRNIGEPLLTDSSSTMFFPTLYSEELMSDNKIALLKGYCANFLVYDFNKDEYRKLFSNDTYIEQFRTMYSEFNTRPLVHPENFSDEWIFLFVKTIDLNNSGRIDENDPSVLYAVSRKGENLQALTNENENAVSIKIYKKLGFALVKIQHDTDNNNSFKANDRQFSFRKIDLRTLKIGEPIRL